jgi:hypothetical protein
MFKKKEQKEVGLTRSQVFDKFMSAILKGDMVAVKPSKVVIKRVTKDTFQVSIVNEKGEELNRAMEAVRLDVGCTLSLADVDRAFEVTMNNGPKISYP